MWHEERGDGVAGAEAPPSSGPRRARAVHAAILAVAGYRGYVEAIPGTTAPFVQASFGLDESGLARLMGWIALASAAAVWLGRLFDTRGRRPVLLACLAAVPFFSLVSALAPGLGVYLPAQLALFALTTGTFAGVSVVMAESMPDARRARALAQVGVADAVGGGGAILLMPLAAALGTWRWLWVAAVLPVLGLGVLRRHLPESERWERAEAQRDPATGARLLFSAHRRRAVNLTGSLLLLQTAFGGLLFWPYYHAVEVAALSLPVASAMLILGGTIGLLGWIAGGRLADRLGRRVTAVLGTVVSVSAGALFYRTSGGTSSLWTLACAYVVFLAGNATALLAMQTATLELFPTRIRATLATWYSAVAASGVVVAQFAVAQLAPAVGGLSSAVAWLGLLAIPGVLWFALLLPETRGRGLDEGAGEDARARSSYSGA